MVFRPWDEWRYIAIACISCDFLADIRLQMLSFGVLKPLGILLKSAFFPLMSISTA